jgi:hypothetical protein
LVATVKVALVAPAGTVTLGIVAASSILELANVTTAPPAGAGPLSVTVPLEESPLPPAIVVGLSVSERIPGPCAMRVAGPTLEPPDAAHSSAATSSEPRFLKDRFR